MKLRTPLVAAILVGTCFSRSTTHAASPVKAAPEIESDRVTLAPPITTPIASPVFAPITSSLAAQSIDEPTEVNAPPPVDLAPAPHAVVPAHTYTVQETVSWMHVDPNKPASAWAGETALDRPEVYARAMKMYGTSIHEATSVTTVSTAGYGSEAFADQVDVRVATVGHGGAEGSGTAIGPRGVGVASDGTEHGHRAQPVSLRDVDVDVGHGISRTAVQGVVRQNFGRLSACYALGSKDAPNLHGRVAVRFVIGEDGFVESATDAGSDLGNDAVVSCVVKNFLLFNFPQPSGGKVNVTYPIVFTPDAAPNNN